MTLFKPAEVSSAYLKMALLGFAGSGKTKTGTKTGIGLVQHMEGLKLAAAERPVYFLDTETGSDWVKPDFDAAGIPLMVAKTRAFADLVAAVKEAEAKASVLIVDSVTHFWKDLCDSYCRRKAEQYNLNSYRLQFQDWGFLKGDDGWGKFSTLFINSALHIIICGRAGFEYDYIEDDQDSKKKNLEKTGVKMKAESEFGFEPSLLVYMERTTNMKRMEVTRTATVLKDRSTLLDGKEFENPDFKDFLPHISRLNLGGTQLGVDTSRNSDHLIPVDERDNRKVQRQIVLDEIESLLVLHYPGTTGKEKQTKLALLRQHFNASWVELEKVTPLTDLRAGYDSLYRGIEGKPSRYSAAPQEPKPTLAEDLKDEIPDFARRPFPHERTMTDDASNSPSPLVKPEQPSLKAKLLEQIPSLASERDCLMWGFEKGYETRNMPETDQREIASALMARQKALMGNGIDLHVSGM